MRFVHLDEAGLSNPGQEPHVVVAGVLVNADTQWKALELALRKLASDHVPGHSDDFCFHAKDVWHGSGAFPRDRFSLEKRIEILMQLASLPKLFDLPIVWGRQHKANLAAQHPHLTAHEVTVTAHSIAFGQCAMLAEKLMRDVWPNEVATFVIENNDNAKREIKTVHAFMRQQEAIEGLEEESKAYLPLSHIVESPLFAEKSESSILQIADTCAFILKRHFDKCPHIGTHFACIRPQMIVWPKSLK